MKCIDSCQGELYAWGRANQVAFDPAKESKHILSLTDPIGDNFRLLGVIFDGALTMTDAVAEVVREAGWKLRTLLRTRRYYNDADLIGLYSAHLLSFLEYRTPAIYHATRDVLSRLDAVQTRFLRNAGVDDVTALIEFHLAPLAIRRDIAMLGLIHRTAIRRGSPHFLEHFKLAEKPGTNHVHRRQMVDPRMQYSRHIVKRSALGLVAIYNMLPPAVVEPACVSVFQRNLQKLVTQRALDGREDWMVTLCPRQPLARHPLLII
jgi:hypothetical protein